MIFPLPCGIMTRAADWAQMYVLLRFISSAAMNSSIEASGMYDRVDDPPALHTITSSLPRSSIILSTRPSTWASSVASQVRPVQSIPASRISEATCSQSSPRRLAI